MAEHSRYSVSDNAAGVDNGILTNKLGIKNQEQLDQAETLLLADTYTHFFDLLHDDKIRFDLDLIFSCYPTTKI
mgnify:FL=1